MLRIKFYLMITSPIISIKSMVLNSVVFCHPPFSLC